MASAVVDRPRADAFRPTGLITKFEVSATKAAEIEKLEKENGIKSEVPSGLNKEVIFLAEQDFAAIQVYVLFGKGLPQTDAQFEKLYNKGDLNSFFLAAGKPAGFKNAYADLQKAFVDVYKHTNDFQTKTLSDIQNWSANIIANAEAVETNLKREVRELQKLVDTNSLLPAEREKIAEKAIHYLNEIATQIRQLEADAAEYSRKFNDFKADTTVDAAAFKKIADVIFDEKAGIGKDIDKITKELVEMEKESNRLSKDFYYYRDCAISVGATMFWNIGGWIAIPTLSVKASNLKKEWDAKIDQINKENTKLASLTRAGADLKSIKSKTDKMAEIVEAAIASITKMGTSATEMKLAFKKIGDHMAKGESQIVKEYIEDWIEDLEGVKPDWAKVKFLARQFMESGGLSLKTPV
ncbi:hypothetical protein H072_2849 [Dactylellina haptotyla CBS 200.50]|uniref:Uncharacterized protein n=1 Tax=Dactylellina haptotyla (strain CBS 200.50) TaxID=1284197 RepID=S8C5W0_DACHA|nr:hypothetical protein H072_2849 [Dactylellina haptotyla CBS 200.50]